MDSGESLPGFENGLRGGMSTTDMVRCRSLVEQTRVLMVEVMSQDTQEEEAEETDVETDSEMGESSSDFWYVDEDERLHLDAARVYVNTIILLGERLGDALGNGMITDDQSSYCKA